MKSVLRAFSLALALIAGPDRASAQSLIDYEQVLAENAARVVSKTGNGGTLLRSLDLGDGITISCEGPVGQADCFGIDHGPNGAIGCLFAIQTEIHAIREICKPSLPEDRNARFDAAYEKVLRFVAENAVPAHDVAALRAVMAEQVALYRESLGEVDLGEECSKFWAPGMDVRMMFDILTEPATDEALADGLAVPRLPVSNPCL